MLHRPRCAFAGVLKEWHALCELCCINRFVKEHVMAKSSSSGGATPAVVKQGGYPELEQSKAPDAAQNTSERALGRKMRGRSKDANGAEPQEPADNEPGSADHGR